MTLLEWMKENEKTQAWVAKKIGSSQGHVSRWANGKRSPGVDVIEKLNKLTKGQVAFIDWRKPKRAAK